jgi:hypothetical protein
MYTMGGEVLFDAAASVNEEPNESVMEFNGMEASATTTPTTITSPLATLFVNETDRVFEQPMQPLLFCCTRAEAA